MIDLVMNKHRLEAFSDGVFAIVITLLILDIRVPEVPPHELGVSLLRLLPTAAAYVMSFFVVALYWLVHHRMSHLIRQVDGNFVWLNMLWLMFVTVLPFPTSLLGHYPMQIIPIVIYGADLILANMTGYIVTGYLLRHPHLATVSLSHLSMRSLLAPYLITNGAYLVAVLCAWISPIVSYLIFAGVLVRLAVRYARTVDPVLRRAVDSDSAPAE